MLGLALGLGVLAIGLSSARINDRMGELLSNQRRTTGAVMSLARAQAPSPTPPATAVSTKDKAFMAGHMSLRDLHEIPGTRVGKEFPRKIHSARLPVTSADQPNWVRTRETGEALDLGSRAPAWRSLTLPAATEVRVATIADEFTFQSFAPELSLSRLHPSNWRETFERADPQVFFCESAWTGGTPPDRPWQGKIYKSVRWAEDRRSELLQILAYCRQNGIPTVFWNKEDPVHFSDRINDFVATASLFDFVFTSAESCVPLYLRDTPVNHADVLPFAVQPKIFNPLGARHRNDAAVFAGTWYSQYPKRSAAAGQIMDLVLAAGHDLVIYDRMFHAPKGYAYPAKYDKYRRPPIPYEQTASEYRENRFGITLNTITDSKTMFARRVYEMAACGAIVLSNTAVGVEHVFGDTVILADRDPERLLEMDESEYSRMQSGAMRIALDNTYAHRARTILSGVGIRTLPVDHPPVLATIVRNRDDFDVALNARNQGWFSDLLCMVADDADEFLLVELAARNLPGVVVESHSRVRSGQYRSRSLLSAPHVFLGEPDDLPSEAWLRDAQRHLSYADLPIRPKSNMGAGAMLHGESTDKLESALMTATDFDKYVCKSLPPTTVYSL